jgi:hypothetical protein
MTTSSGVTGRAKFCHENCDQLMLCKEYIFQYGTRLATHGSKPLTGFNPSHVDVMDLILCGNQNDCADDPSCQSGPAWPTLKPGEFCMDDLTSGFPELRPVPSSTPDSSSEPDIIVLAMALVIPAVSVGVVILLFCTCLWRRRSKNQLPMVIDNMALVWDDDVAHAIPETLIDEKRLELEEQIGEGEIKY